MQYNVLLSATTGHDIFVSNRGVIYLQFKSNMISVGNTSTSSVMDIRNAIEEHI